MAHNTRPRVFWKYFDLRMDCRRETPAIQHNVANYITYRSTERPGNQAAARFGRCYLTWHVAGPKFPLIAPQQQSQLFSNNVKDSANTPGCRRLHPPMYYRVCFLPPCPSNRLSHVSSTTTKTQSRPCACGTRGMFQFYTMFGRTLLVLHLITMLLVATAGGHDHVQGVAAACGSCHQGIVATTIEIQGSCFIDYVCLQREDAETIRGRLLVDFSEQLGDCLPSADAASDVDKQRLYVRSQ
jgi:hypothetical protein